ncbi:hypothetical protein KN815_20565 [Streptomyces sp. 4503]|uniref:Uncharacterized protein n=1 Tax=Streptomyces niphimycinicus TaxID=2842201 RepID=A0ABS6CHK9_9ACTN|nr:hypothetical protein [Streptomyces niphimycinicus]MBU3866372.1 hypothetical protein [Streptomyces niphimycinicus]
MALSLIELDYFMEVRVDSVPEKPVIMRAPSRRAASALRKSRSRSAD